MIIRYDMPLAEMVFGFYDRLKTVSRGYASLDYEPKDYQRADSSAWICWSTASASTRCRSSCTARPRTRGRDLCVKMKEVIPRQQFEVAIQAAIGRKIIARTTVKALRKNVTAKCYGGDISRKRKLLEKQKEGKKRMKSVGTVEIPQEAFLTVLKVD